MTTQQRSTMQPQAQGQSSEKRVEIGEDTRPQSTIAGIHVRRRAPDATVPRTPSEHELLRFRY